MAHESFEDAAVAAEMNRLFVNIKVDREERPDLDRIYQLAHHLLTRRNGGWPFTNFIAPDGTPFFRGTYFPKMPRYNMPGFPRVLHGVAQAWAEKREDIAETGASVLRELGKLNRAQTSFEPLTHDLLDLAFQGLSRQRDPAGSAKARPASASARGLRRTRCRLTSASITRCASTWSIAGADARSAPAPTTSSTPRAARTPPSP